LFAGLILTLAISLVGANTAFAEIPEQIYKLAQKGAKIAEKIEKLESKEQTAKVEQKIQKLKAKLDKITSVINAYGLYTEKQFANLEPEPISAAACSKDCPPVVLFRSGFDYRTHGFWHGFEYGDWKILGIVATSDISRADASKYWDYDYGRPFTQVYVDPAGTTAQLLIDTTVWNGKNLVKDYASHSETITESKRFHKFYEPTTISPGKAGDSYRVLGYLQSLS
jgi:DNA-binding protein H-NS